MKKVGRDSLDLIRENIEKLKEIFPEVFTEGRIDFEKLKENLGEFVEESEEKYQFTWFGKRKANQLALTPTRATLRPAKTESKNWKKTKNLYIEGDNLEVLKVLQKAYYQKVKMIYIDPPYNTGKDFIYKDNYSEPLKNYLTMTGQIDEEGNPLTTNRETSGRKHSNWLNMMYPRLKLARNLLRDDGVIFISIDDNEIANLRKIMDEIFGEENFLYQLTVVNNLNGNDNSSGMMETHEYCLIYAKNKEKFEFGVLPIDDEKELEKWQIDEKGYYKEGGGLKATGEAAERRFRPNLFFPIYINENSILKKTDSNIEKLDKLKVEKNDIITSSLSIKDVITYTFKLPISTPKEQLDAACDIQLYENAGLDLNKQYKHFYIKKELTNEHVYLIEAIAIEEELLKSKFSNIIEKTNYIDYISLSVFAFSEFYELYQKEAKRDAFVYLDNNQSFIAVYENGEYLYSKTLNPLKPLLKSLNLDYNKFLKLMESKGVKKENYDLDDFLMANEVDKFFSDYFMAINNRMSYGKSIFYLDNVDNIYFYTPFNIRDIDTLKDFWELSGVNFEIIHNEEINLLDKLTLNYNEKHYKDKINFSIFPKPPKFYKTKTFQLIMIILISFGIFGADFTYRNMQNNQLKTQITNIKKQLKTKQTKLEKLKIKNKIVLNKLHIYKDKISQINKKFTHIKEVLQTALILTNKQKTNKDFIIISNALKNNKLHTFLISKDKNEFKIGIYTNIANRKNIANFMNSLLKNNYQNIRTNEISTTDTNYYMSLIRFSK